MFVTSINTLALASFLLSTASAVLPSETSQLADSDISSSSIASLLAFGDTTASVPTPIGCNVFPGDAGWPSDKTWAALNTTLGGSLIKTIPIASPCYNGPNYNAARCAYVSDNWLNSSIHELDPSSMMSVLYQGNTCLPTSDPNSTCLIGGYPSYVVNATTVKQVQLGVNFARNTGIRLVVKNTGHDFSGKSGGAGALSIWTHYLNAIEYLPVYKDPSIQYSGPAFVAGSGVIAKDFYKAASAEKLLIIGGEGVDVGIMGGYLQNGGHSPYSSVYGLAADQVLETTIVTADGSYLTASPTQNTDLYWALRGGGASTWGVTTSVTVRAHPTEIVTGVTFLFTAETSDIFWAGVKQYYKRFLTYADAGIYSYFYIIATGGVPLFDMVGLIAPNMTTAQTTALLQPWISELTALGIQVQPVYTTYTDEYSAITGTFPQEPLTYNPQGIIGSRLFPRSAFASYNSEAFNSTFDTWATDNLTIISFNIAAPNIYNQSSAVLPAWRSAAMHTIQAITWPEGSSNATIQAARTAMTARISTLKSVTPGSGAYVGESDAQELDWQDSFYGANYPRLLSIKKTVDPWGVFWADRMVGSENRSVRSSDVIQDENGRLCWD